LVQQVTDEIAVAGLEWEDDIINGVQPQNLSAAAADAGITVRLRKSVQWYSMDFCAGSVGTARLHWRK